MCVYVVCVYTCLFAKYFFKIEDHCLSTSFVYMSVLMHVCVCMCDVCTHACLSTCVSVCLSVWDYLESQKGQILIPEFKKIISSKHSSPIPFTYSAPELGLQSSGSTEEEVPSYCIHWSHLWISQTFPFTEHHLSSQTFASTITHQTSLFLSVLASHIGQWQIIWCPWISRLRFVFW